MALSRLENFIKNVEGNILYVNPNDLDSTDDISNQGNSLTRPFKTIQRALLEAARFSYQVGLNNDKFDKTTIMLYPGEHVIDNRPGYSIDNSGTIKDVNGIIRGLSEFNGISIFDLNNPTNELYKYNSIHGGLVIPRGTSIVGMDLRKTKLRPKYVPDPEDSNIDNSAVFRVTGGCYFWQFSIFDGSGSVYKNTEPNTYSPDFSHHKLTVFEYADGVNVVKGKGLTDLQMYYHKLTKAYGPASDRIINDYPANTDFQPRIQESRIVGSLGGRVGISSIFAGDSVTPSTSVTVVTSDPHELGVDSPIRINGVNSGNSPAGYDGLFIVSSVDNENQFKYTSSIVPSPAYFQPLSATVNVEVDTVTGASPYIFNVSMRSVFGMQGLHADGDKATGFKSMVVAQFTGISLQKDDLAFVKYNKTTGIYDDQSSPGADTSPLHLDSRSIYKPGYENTHIKISNEAVVQAVSIFAIGYAKHFECINGGDISLTNSNSNFGAVALSSKGFRKSAFTRDNRGFITSVVPTQALLEDNSPIVKSIFDIDAVKTRTVANPSRLYLHGYNSEFISPPSSFDDYKVGAKVDEKLYAVIPYNGAVETKVSPVLMETASINEISSSKKYFVNKVGGNNDIDTSTRAITLTKNHDLQDGEKVRVFSENGSLPDGINHNQVYYAINVSNNRIKLAPGYDEATSTPPSYIELNNRGGTISIVSNVTDKSSGDVGHPIQWDTVNQQWYINSSSNNEIYIEIQTSRTPDVIPGVSIKRKKDSRRNKDLSYKLRYVIPKEETDARAPLDSFNIQESSTTGDYTSGTLTSTSKSKNNKLIFNCSYNSGVATVICERTHNLKVGNKVIINAVKSISNPEGTAGLGFNGTFFVKEILDDLTFTYDLVDDPGQFSNTASDRVNAILPLPNFEINQYNTALSIYSSEAIQDYIPLVSDGIYHLSVVDSSVSPDVNFFDNGEYRFQQAVGDLIPRTDRDNPIDDYETAVSYADKKQIGTVITNDPKKSISKESISNFLCSSGKASSIINVSSEDVLLGSSRVGSAVSVTTSDGHGFGKLSSINIMDHNGVPQTGTNYVPGTYYGVRLVGPSTTGGATAEVNIDSTGKLSTISIMDGGSAYGVGHTCLLDGIPRSSSGDPGVVEVVSGDVLNEVGTSFEISGVKNITVAGIDISKSSLNGSHQVFKIIDKNTFTYQTKTSVGTTITEIYSGYVARSGPGIPITSVEYDNSVGILTVECDESHGLSVGNRVRVVGIETGKTFKDKTDGVTDVDVNQADENFYSDYFVVDNIGIGASKNFTAKVEKDILGTHNLSSITDSYVLKTAYASQSGLPVKEDEKLSGRLASISTGVMTRLSVLDAGNTDIFVDDTSGFYKGDFIQIRDEIIRITDDPAGNKLVVQRGQLGTQTSGYPIDEVVRKISPIPVELRRPSILRASGHTFEYLGFGPGNYSTALPQRQDRVRGEREIINSQARVSFGGIAVYTGMNDRGDFYIGNKRIISPTGEEIVVDTPFPADTSENETSRLKIDTDDVLVGKRLRVEGGLSQEMVSSFGGPVVFSNNINVLGESGIQAVNLNLSGDLDQTRKISISDTKPLVDGKVGDIVLNGTPASGGFAGWVYTKESEWRNFGIIGSGSGNDITVDDIESSNITTQNLNVTGIGTINQAFIKSGIATVQSVDTDDLYVTGIATFTDSSQVNIRGNLDILSNINVKAENDGDQIDFIVNEGSDHPHSFDPVDNSRGIRIINNVTTVHPVDPTDPGQAGAGSGNIQLDFRYGNNFEIHGDFTNNIKPLSGTTNFINPEPESVTAGQQGSIELTTESGSAVTIEWGDAFYFPGGTPPAIGAGTTAMIGYYVFESGQTGANPSPGKIMISAIEDLRPAS